MTTFFWEPGGFDKKRSREKVELLIQQSKEGTSWVVEGVFGELAEQYLDVAELFVWLDIDWHICNTCIEERGSKSKMHLDREQSEEKLRELIDWASHYYDRQDLRSYEGHKALLEKFTGNKAHLRSERDVNKFMEKRKENG